MRSLYMVAIGFVSIQSAITAVTALRHIRTTERQTRARETQKKPTTTTATTDCTHQNRTNEYNEQSMPPQVRFHDNYCCCSRLFRFVFKIVVSSRSSDGQNERWNKQTDTFKCALRNRSVRTTNQINTQYTHTHVHSASRSYTETTHLNFSFDIYFGFVRSFDSHKNVSLTMAWRGINWVFLVDLISFSFFANKYY